MDQFGWPLIMALIGGVIATFSGIFVEFAKQFIPQLDEAQRAKVLRSSKLAVWSIRGAILGLVLGVWVAAAWFKAPVMQIIILEEGPMIGDAPKAAPEHAEMPTGESKFTDTSLLIILACGLGGGFIGYASKWSALERRDTKPSTTP